MKILVIFFLLTVVSPQCCNRFVGWRCQDCPQGTHLYLGHCLFNMPHCSSYVNGFDCEVCQEKYELKDGECSLIPLPQEEILDLQNLSGDSQNAFKISDDLLKSFHRQIRNSQVTGSKIIKEEGKTDQIVIQYEANGIFYQGFLEFDLSTFIFRQLAFKQIPSPTIQFNKPEPKIIDEKPIDREQYDEKISALTNLLLKELPEIDEPIGGKVLSYDDNSEQIVIIYKAKDKEEYYKVVGRIVQLVVSLLSFDKTTEIGTESQYGPIKIQPKQLIYIPQNLEEIQSSMNYQVVKDFINRNLEGYADIDPKTVGQSVQGQIIYFKMFFIKLNESQCNIYAYIDTQDFVVVINEEEVLKEGKQIEKFQDIELTLMFKDTNFILVREAISSQLNKKYENASITSLKKSQNKEVIRYIIIFLLPDSQWQTTASISIASSVVTIEKDEKIKDIAIEEKTSEEQTMNNGQQQTTDNQQDTKNNEETMNNENEEKKTDMKKMEEQKMTNITEEIPNTGEQMMKNEQMTKNEEKQPENNEEKQPEDKKEEQTKNTEQTPPENEQAPKENQKQTPINNQQEMNKQEDKTENMENTNTESQPTQNTDNQQPKQTQKKQETKQPEVPDPEPIEEAFDFDTSPLPSNILSKVQGFTRLTKSEVEGSATAQRIINLLKSAHQRELKDAELFAVFTKKKGFVEEYEIFHKNGNIIYHAKVNYDILRRRSLVLSFERLGF